MKKTLQTLVLLLVALLPVTASARDLLGDVNQDDHVNISDVTSLISYLLSSDSDTYGTTNADVNRDGLITIADVSVLINYLLNGGELNPPETETFEVNGVKFTMVKVEGGTFTMGATAEQGDEYEPDELPTHQVTLSTYNIGQTEVTQELWQAVMGENPSWLGYPSQDRMQCPVDWITWAHCQEFIARLNVLTGRNFRLPTEAEWEFAARGGNRSRGYKYAGSNTLEDVAWYVENSRTDNYYDRAGVPDPGLSTRCVALKQPNELGLYDMSGNVRELCQDRYGAYSSMAQTDPVGPAALTELVFRGGSAFSETDECRLSHRAPTLWTDFWAYGLRLALDEAESPKFSMSKNTVQVFIGESKTVNVLNGHGSYTVTGGDSYVDIDVEGDCLTITGKAEGTATIYVTDNATGVTTAFTAIVYVDSEIMNGMRMVKVEGGTFMMGATAEQGSDWRENEQPAHEVTVSSFYMAETEFRQDFAEALLGFDPSRFHYDPPMEMHTREGRSGYTPYEYTTFMIDCPVEQISWYDCQRVIARLNKSTGRHFRLPTEAEWEYAARGGKFSQGYKYPGSDSIGEVKLDWNGTRVIPSMKPNELGLSNMSGNVMEWCQDFYGDYSGAAQTDPAGPMAGSKHVTRGGGWNSDARDCRVSSREGFCPEYMASYLGMRLVHDMEDSPKFRLSETVIELELRYKAFISILNGSGNYDYTVAEGADRVGVDLDGNTLVVIAGAPGVSTIYVTDNATGATTVLVVVVPKVEPETETFTVNGVSFTMKAVHGGLMKMGAQDWSENEASDNEKPSHLVRLSSFSIGETEVTQALWQAVMGSNPSYFMGNLNRPVESVSWKDCQQFITKLNELTGRKFRLPYEAEWEYAAAFGLNDFNFYDHASMYSGSVVIDGVAWYYDNSYAVGIGDPSYGTHRVKTKRANALGLYDMSGNVWEWCQDWYGAYSSEPQADPTGPATGSYRVMRGGSWCNSAKYCRVACRNYNEPDYAEYHVGLRLAL